jgi:hypothetical protein
MSMNKRNYERLLIALIDVPLGPFDPNDIISRLNERYSDNNITMRNVRRFFKSMFRGYVEIEPLKKGAIYTLVYRPPIPYGLVPK